MLAAQLAEDRIDLSDRQGVDGFFAQLVKNRVQQENP